jgi:Helix-turn-helix domain
MSIRVMTNVWQFSTAAGTDLLVLLALADIADDNGECWPSVGYVARKCRIDPRTTQRRIRSLEKLGEVVVIVGGGKTRTTGATASNRYRITVHMPDEGEGGDLPEGGTRARGRVAPVPGGRVAHAPPNTSVVHVSRHVIPSQAKKTAHELTVLAMEQPRKPAGKNAFPKAFTIINAILEAGHPPDAVEVAIRTGGIVWSIGGFEMALQKCGRVGSSAQSSRNVSTIDAVLSQMPQVQAAR